MSAITIARPGADEHSAFYGGYVASVPEGNLLSLLREQIVDTAALLRRVPADRGDFAYAPGKWTIKEVVGHMADTERVMAYRALRFTRADAAPLAGFDQNAWVTNAHFERRQLDGLVAELEATRAATIQFVSHLDAESLDRRGTANGNSVTVRALLYIIAGHERHHVAILREQYSLH